eukprot:CAMPEP_0118933426 /NCGR_PEP_ID=MMETSP1169-20130426/11980_1 /TAXON_ID=36882 /ORGANISM="Pyramimonas obovata, Strain CCMP722" /LENGTH=316 /DNA_ID=CAMNT_0006876183 /DNA_START=278 /DNA_END=1228 /DNA_ORIENTATION=-
MTQTTVLPASLQAAVNLNVRYYFELTVSPGFDLEIPTGQLQKECQDEGVIIRRFGENVEQVFLGVFDGHGVQGLKASRFTGERMPMLLAQHPLLSTNYAQAFLDVCREVGRQLLSGTCGFDCQYSGTTACFGMLTGNGTLLLGNVGDSRAVVGRADASGRVTGIDLTNDDKPTDAPEKARIEASGGRVAQMEYDPGEFDGPFRVFLREANIPGLAMSRSLGDGLAESVGVIPDPTCSEYRILPEDKFVLLATDGLWEVFTSDEACKWAEDYFNSPEKMARMPCTQALAEEAQRRWTRMDDDCVVDDTSILIVRLRP